MCKNRTQFYKIFTQIQKIQLQSYGIIRKQFANSPKNLVFSLICTIFASDK